MENIFLGLQHFIASLLTAILVILPFYRPPHAISPPSSTAGVTKVGTSSAVLGISKTESFSQSSNAPTIPASTSSPSINCTGPDGKLIKLTQKQCNDFNKAWQTASPNSNPPSNTSSSSQNTSTSITSSPSSISTNQSTTQTSSNQQINQVHAGDIIGNMISNISSPCSSGIDLEFEVQNNGQLVDPANYLSSKSVNWDNSPDGPFSFTGTWSWPLSDPVYIEQGYGMTYWAKLGWYTTPPGHPGITLYSHSSTVYAVHNGTLSSGTMPCGGGSIPYVKVDHGDGITTLYLHVNPVSSSATPTPTPSPSPTPTTSPVPSPSV